MAANSVPTPAMLIVLVWYVTAGGLLLFLPTKLAASEWMLRLFGVAVLFVGGFMLWANFVR